MFTAFVSDVFSRRIVGWRTAASMPIELPLDALEMALWTRGRAGETDDQGRSTGWCITPTPVPQPGFKGSMQHRLFEARLGDR